MTFIGTFASTFIHTTRTSITAPFRCFEFMASRISSSGSGTPGRKKVERAGTRTRTHMLLQYTQKSSTSPNALRTPLGRSRKTRRPPTTAHPPPHLHATRLQTSRTKGRSCRGRLKVLTSLSWNPRHQLAPTLPSFQTHLLPLHRLQILLKPSMTLPNNLTCLMIQLLQALPLHHRHLYIYHLAQTTPQEPPDLHPAPLNP